ncbi:hypothetical protein MTR_5g069215 [Medicago truncatula]|uniref:Uncharacterized protein n=1 Tax=Medicago truncatula TaxID=3880 RepID=A0A072UFC2_MEDTR|nr:hypothetical protein MTR_5g069215 [Medicago truncatula]
MKEKREEIQFVFLTKLIKSIQEKKLNQMKRMMNQSEDSYFLNHPNSYPFVKGSAQSPLSAQPLQINNKDVDSDNWLHIYGDLWMKEGKSSE